MRAAIAVLATVVALAGCTTRPAPAPPAAGPPADLAALLDADAARREAVRALRAWARLSWTSPAESRSARQLLVAERPDRLRLEVFSPFGAVFVLASAGGRLAAYDRQEAVVYRGAATAENLQRYTQVDLPVARAVELLLATPPLDATAPTTVAADGDTLVVRQRTPDGGTRITWYAAAGEPLRYEERNTAEAVQLRASYEDWALVEGVRLPQRVQFELPASSQRIAITLSDIEVNPPLAGTVFALQTPSGSREVDLGREVP